MAASATLALKAGVWFRRGRLLIVSPDSLGTACPPSGRNSTYRPVQISAAGSPFGVVGVGIEVVADPFREFGVAFVLGILDGLEEFGIAPGAASIFWRAATADLDQARVEHAWLGIGEMLDLDRVLPTVAEVIEVRQRLCADVFENVAEPSLAGVDEVAGPIGVGIGRAPADVAGADLIEMAVGPAHGRLDSQMQPVEPDVERHL